MSKKSVLRTCLITAVFVMLMSISIWADQLGADIPVSYSVADLYVEATDNTMLHRLVIPSDGVISITGVEHGSTRNWGLRFSLLQANSVAINGSGRSYTYVDGTDKNSSNFSKEFALKAGLYYIRVTNTDYYTIRTMFTAVNDQGNSKKKKGTTLKKKATKTALFGAGETYAKTEWFKFTLKKPQKVTLTINTYGDASFRVTFSGPKPFKKGDTNYISPGYTRTVKYWVQRGRKKLKLSKGTYYIKVQRSSNDESGYCSISWK